MNPVNTPNTPKTPKTISTSGQSCEDDVFQIGKHCFSSRLIMGTGRYDSFEQMQATHLAGGTQCVTIAVRRERLNDSSGRNILDFIDLDRYVLLPNTAGSYDAKTAVRCAKMGREILRNLENPGADWVKLEVLGDSRTLLPDPYELLIATELLVADGFDVLCYTNDDPITARRLKNAGATAVMPAASPIGSGLGIINTNNLKLILDDLKREDPGYPVIIDAGIGTSSDAAMAMELGFDAVLLNSAVALAQNPIGMAKAMELAVKAGRLAGQSGRIPKSSYGSASSPDVGVISKRKGG
jgi:thiazole synthase